MMKRRTDGANIWGKVWESMIAFWGNDKTSGFLPTKSSKSKHALCSNPHWKLFLERNLLTFVFSFSLISLFRASRIFSRRVWNIQLLHLSQLELAVLIFQVGDFSQSIRDENDYDAQSIWDENDYDAQTIWDENEYDAQSISDEKITSLSNIAVTEDFSLRWHSCNQTRMRFLQSNLDEKFLNFYQDFILSTLDERELRSND